ncbi:MAG: ATP-binding cassette domain-containing protein, partial [TACK group archaeon]|nr:ATP-binding cassette domain-containing protein [TACK group archaeon]
MPSVRLEKVSKSFGKNRVLKEVDLEVRDGEFMVLLGPSGSGKTTTLRIVAGLEIQDSGHVYIGDKLVDSLP